MTDILLIRHAVNDFVKTGRLAGWTPGVHLNDEGRQQSETLAQRLEGLPIHAIYSSPLDRAVETAEPLAQLRQLPIRILDNIGEVRYGDWTGGVIAELAKHELWHGVQFFPSSTRFPNGETIGEMQARAVAQCEALRVAHADEIVAVVSHADVIKAIVAHYVGMHLDLFQRLFIAPASLTWLHLSKGGPRLVVMNDTGAVPRPLERKARDQAEEPASLGGVEAQPAAVAVAPDGAPAPADSVGTEGE